MNKIAIFGWLFEHKSNSTILSANFIQYDILIENLILLQLCLTYQSPEELLAI